MFFQIQLETPEIESKPVRWKLASWESKSCWFVTNPSWIRSGFELLEPSRTWATGPDLRYFQKSCPNFIFPALQGIRGQTFMFQFAPTDYYIQARFGFRVVWESWNAEIFGTKLQPLFMEYILSEWYIIKKVKKICKKELNHECTLI